jgi:hypothetical protein
MTRQPPLAIRSAQAFGELPREASNLPRSFEAALSAVGDSRRDVNDRAALYAALYALRRRITKALDPVRGELAEHMARGQLRRLGPLALSSTSIDPAYPCNEPDNWTDYGVQDAMRELADDPATAPYVRHIPEHFEIATVELAAGVVREDPVALRLLHSLKARHWRTEAGRSLGIRVAGS